MVKRSVMENEKTALGVLRGRPNCFANPKLSRVSPGLGHPPTLLTLVVTVSVGRPLDGRWDDLG